MTERLGEGMDRAFSAAIARLSRAMKQFHRPQRRLLGQGLQEPVPAKVIERGSTRFSAAPHSPAALTTSCF
jgi:hypothetical protein